MKVLFAVGNDQWAKTTSERYYEKYGETLEYKNVFYFKALIEEVRRDKTYDRIVIHEDLEQYRAKDIEQLDRKLYSCIDTITDEIQDSEIIYICSDRRTKDDKFIMRLYNLGIYNLLIGDDRNINPLCDIIKKPKTKREAKEYLNINSSSIGETGSIMRDDEVDETQMMNILNYYEKIKNQPEKYVATFEQISEQYSRAQLKVIASLLPNDVKEKIYAEPKFRFLLGDMQTSTKKEENNQAEKNTSQKNEKKYTKGIMDIFRGKFKTKDGNEMKKAKQQVENQRESENKTNEQQELAKKGKREAEAREQQELAEKARREAEAREQQELAEKARREAEAREQQELAEKARREAEAREQQELAERSRREAEAREQQELAEKSRREAEAREQQELAEKARREAENRKNNQQTSDDVDIIVDNALSMANGQKAEQEMAEQKAREEALARQQKAEQEIAEQRAREEALARQQKAEREMAEQRAREEALKRQQAEQKENVNRIDANVISANQESEEEKRVREEREKLAREQERIRKEQAELEEERRKLREAQAKIAQEKNQIESVEVPKQVQTYEAVPVVARDYKKMVVFVGANKAGTTFMVNAVANQLSNSKIPTAILDMTKDKGMYYIYNQGDKTLRKIASECMQNLSAGEDTYMPVSRYLKVYTTVPGSVADARRGYKHKSVIDVVKNNSNITIVDADFTTPIDYFEQASEIYVIQDMDILKMQETTSFLREMKNRNMDMKKVKIIINKYVKSILTPRKIIEGISYYKDPEMTFTDVLLNNKVSYSIVPYNINNYIKYIEALCRENMNFKGYTADFLQIVDEIAEQVYPRNGLAKKKGGFFR